MDIKLTPALPGCLYVPCAICSLGTLPLILKMGEGHFPKTIDDQGILTRSGKRYLWSDFERVQEVRALVNGVHVSSELMLYAGKKGKVSLHYRRLVNRKEAIDYALAHLPATVQRG